MQLFFYLHDVCDLSDLCVCEKEKEFFSFSFFFLISHDPLISLIRSVSEPAGCRRRRWCLTSARPSHFLCGGSGGGSIIYLYTHLSVVSLPPFNWKKGKKQNKKQPKTPTSVEYSYILCVCSDSACIWASLSLFVVVVFFFFFECSCCYKRERNSIRHVARYTA